MNCATSTIALGDDVSRAAGLEGVSFIGGGALLAGGVVPAPSNAPPSGARWMMVGPSVARGTLGIAAVGSWQT